MGDRLRGHEKEKLLEHLETYFLSDVTLKLFTLQYSEMELLKKSSQEFNYDLLNLQKVGNVLYAQYRITLSNIQVDGKFV